MDSIYTDLNFNGVVDRIYHPKFCINLLCGVVKKQRTGGFTFGQKNRASERNAGSCQEFSQIGWQTLKMEIKENYQIVPDHILSKLKCKR